MRFFLKIPADLAQDDRCHAAMQSNPKQTMNSFKKVGISANLAKLMN